MTEIEILRLITVGCIAIPLVVTLALTPVSMRVAGRIGAIDIPKDERRMHNRPVPCFGGMAIFAGVILALALIQSDFFQGIFLLKNYARIGEGDIVGLILGGTVVFVAGV
ncbi:MAG: hypothetical protein LBG50_04355, partial [Clostridiales Family XIII bacterium]|nr:hypothetical protein [Clostridiales Family XIII bacterium]